MAGTVETFGYVIRCVTPPHEVKRWGLPVRGITCRLNLSLLCGFSALTGGVKPRTAETQGYEKTGWLAFR